MRLNEPSTMVLFSMFSGKRLRFPVRSNPVPLCTPLYTLTPPLSSRSTISATYLRFVIDSQVIRTRVVLGDMNAPGPRATLFYWLSLGCASPASSHSSLVCWHGLYAGPNGSAGVVYRAQHCLRAARAVSRATPFPKAAHGCVHPAPAFRLLPRTAIGTAVAPHRLRAYDGSKGALRHGAGSVS